MSIYVSIYVTSTRSKLGVGMWSLLVKIYKHPRTWLNQKTYFISILTKQHSNLVHNNSKTENENLICRLQIMFVYIILPQGRVRRFVEYNILQFQFPAISGVKFCLWQIFVSYRK